MSYGDSRGRPPRPPAGPFSILWGIVVSAFLVCCCPCGLFGGWVVFRDVREGPPARAVVDDFLHRTQKNDLQGAYALTTNQYQSEVSPKDFVFLMSIHKLMTDHTSRKVTKTEIMFNDATVWVTLESPGNRSSHVFRLIKEGGVWKIYRIN